MCCSRATGAGYVAAKCGDYARALASGVTCVPLLLETIPDEADLRRLVGSLMVVSAPAAVQRERVLARTPACKRMMRRACFSQTRMLTVDPYASDVHLRTDV